MNPAGSSNPDHSDGAGPRHGSDASLRQPELFDIGEGREAERRGAPPAPALPCLNSECGNPPRKILTASQAKTAYALTFNVKCLADRFGLARLGFLTLTTSGKAGLPMIEFQRRYKSLNNGVIRRRYLASIMVPERGEKTRRLHAHLLVVLAHDILAGLDFAAVARQDYRSANAHLRAEWAFWRSTAPKYGFGRTELMPIKSTAEGISKYVGKYIAKQISQRDPEDRHAKLVRYSKGARAASSVFAWVTPRSWLWRRKLAITAEKLGIRDLAGFSDKFGPRWGHALADIIGAFQLNTYPTARHAELDGWPVAQSTSAGVAVTMDGNHTLERLEPAELERRLRKDSRIVSALKSLVELARDHPPTVPAEDPAVAAPAPRPECPATALPPPSSWLAHSSNDP